MLYSMLYRTIFSFAVILKTKSMFSKTVNTSIKYMWFFKHFFAMYRYVYVFYFCLSVGEVCHVVNATKHDLDPPGLKLWAAIKHSCSSSCQMGKMFVYLSNLCTEWGLIDHLTGSRVTFNSLTKQSYMRSKRL